MSDRRLIRRDRDAEAAAAAKVLEAGFQRAPAHPGEGIVFGRYDVARARLAGAVRTLLDAGWRVEAEGKLYRQPGNFKLSVTSGIDWFDLDGEVDFGGVSATLPELLRALRRGETMVRLGDGTLRHAARGVAEEVRPLADLGTVEGDRLRFRPAQAGLLDALLASQPEVSVDALFAKARDQLAQFEGVSAAKAPRAFRGELRPYQEEGLGWLAFLRRFGFGGCLADDMGLGKTIQVLAMLAGRPRRKARPSIVVVPKSLVFNWEQEAARFTPRLRVLAHTGPERAASAAALRRSFADVDLMVTTYGTLRNDIAFLREIESDYVILDEAQAIKNADSQSAKAARLLRGRPSPGADRHADREPPRRAVVALRVPEPRHARHGARVRRRGGREAAGTGDAWRRWRARCGRSSCGAPRKRSRRTCPASTSRRSSARWSRSSAASTTSCATTTAQPARQDREGRPGQVEDPGAGGAAAAAPGRLPPRPGRPEARGARAAASSTCCCRISRRSGARATRRWSSRSSRASWRLVRDRLDAAKVPYEYLDGQTQDRQARVARFQTDDACPLFLISLKAGGLGLNLTAADYVFLLDPWWNPAVEAQAIDRAHRIGQTKRVFAYRLICRDTVEEKVAALQETKRDLAASIIAADGSAHAEAGSRDAGNAAGVGPARPVAVIGIAWPPRSVNRLGPCAPLQRHTRLSLCAGGPMCSIS